MKISRRQARRVGGELKVDFSKVDLGEFRKGLEVELEHKKITGGDLILTGMIALDHLKEDPKYYTKLGKVGL